MGLDAVVFCDCVERNQLKSPHPFPQLLYIAPNGSPEIRSRSKSKIERHDSWMQQACKHEDMMIAGGDLGNTSSIEFLRQVLREAVSSPARDFSVLWKKVVYCGSHCGDHLRLCDVTLLHEELRRFRKIKFDALKLKDQDIEYIEQFQKTLSITVKTAIRIKKPIAF